MAIKGPFQIECGRGWREIADLSVDVSLWAREYPLFHKYDFGGTPYIYLDIATQLAGRSIGFLLTWLIQDVAHIGRYAGVLWRFTVV